MKKKALIGLTVVVLGVATMGSTAVIPDRTEAVTTKNIPAVCDKKETKEAIVVALGQKQVVIRKGNLFEPTEVTIGYYVVRDDMETISSIATKLGLTEDYLMSVNTSNEFEKGEFVEIPDADWNSLEKVYCIVSEGDCLGEIANYFYTTVDEILELNPSVKDANVIYKSDIIQVQ